MFIKILATVNFHSGQIMNRGLHASNMEVVTFTSSPGTHPNCLHRAAYPAATNRQTLINLIQAVVEFTKEEKTLIIQV